jgi:tetratricopeptide (TPR) repeat protein
LLTECASASDVSAEVIARQEVLFALKAMARLPMGLRATALLNLVEGLSSGEAAGILGISEEAARMRLSRARALMAGLSLRPDEALSARTSLAEGYHFLAGVLLRQGKEAQSDRAILRALDFNNESAYDIWTNQVLARGLPHEVAACEQAIRVARDAVDRQPEDPWRLLVMGNLEYWERENYQAAERLFHAAAADRGGAGRTARLHLGHLYTHTDRPRQALSVLEPLVRQYPSPDFAVARTAYSLALCGEPAAREWAERARAVAMSRPIGTPRNNRVDRVHAGHLRLLAARCFEILGDVRQAAACFGAAEGAFPADWRRRPPGAP